ncbi:MAG TPA: RNase H family protein [Verrucomicrobiae bacterium]|nr:RNase H family protein [Verrucomicrobiae bacterium]
MITYYTDGSCSPNPGPGGFAVIKNMQPILLGAEKVSTNIRMEGKAIIAALKDADGAECQIYTDSEFWVNVITKWSITWEKNGWKKKGGDIKNLEIVQEVAPLYRNSNATLTWVRGHADDPGNILADEWANIARERFKKGESLAITTAATHEEPPQVPELINQYLLGGRLMQLATVNNDQPWVCTVHYVYVRGNVYWLSLPSRRHSQEIECHDKVAFAMAVKHDKPVVGIQGEGRAEVVRHEPEIAEVMQAYVSKYGIGQDFYENFLAGKNQHWLYKCPPRLLVLFDEVHFDKTISRQEWRPEPAVAGA